MMKKPFLLTAIVLSLVMAFGATASLAQNLRVSGRVVDSHSNDPLTGSTVAVKGTGRSTSTDFDGQYLIEASVGETLVFSRLGYDTQEIKLDEHSSKVDISMVESQNRMEDLVVVGYGVQRKQSVVGAISQVKSSDLMRTGGVTSVSNALTGLVPGLTTLNYSGKPGSDNAQLLIRGASTWNDSAPLILVDGIERDMDGIDINEIESISVLKDASATAVFGVRGGNGVILVTTKRGKEGKPVLSVSANVTAKTESKMPTFLNSYNALWLRNQAIENELGADPGVWSTYITPVDVLRQYRDHSNPEMYPDVDWQKEMVRDWSWSQRYSVDLSGGTKFVKYFASMAYTYDGDVLKGQNFGQGYVPRNDFQRFNFRLNLDFQPTKTTTFGVGLDGSQGMERTTNATPAYLWLGVYGKGPDQYPVRYSDGTFANNVSGYNMYNPVEYFNYSGMSKEIRTDMNASFTLDQKLDFVTKGLSLKGLANFRNYYIGDGPDISANRPMTKYIDWRTGTTTWNNPSPDKTGFDYVPNPSTISTETIKTDNKTGIVEMYKYLMYQLSLNYDRSFGQHRVGAMGVFKRITDAYGQAFPSFREEWAGRVTYDYAGRYLIEGNAGYNGSEQFGDGKKFGFFPSVAAGWVATEEPFVKKLNIDKYMNLLKFRYSWGKVGSDNTNVNPGSGIGSGTAAQRWLYATQWSSVTNSAWLGVPTQTTPIYPGYAIKVIGNPDAQWETAIKNNIAVETGLFRNRLTGEFDYYWGHRDNIFMDSTLRNVPDWFGAPAVSANLGKTKEWGWELDVRWNATTHFGLNYYATVSISKAQDKVIYEEDPELTPAYQQRAGFPIGQQHSYIDKGPVQSWDQMYTGVKGSNIPSNYIPGMLQLVDYNGDGVVDVNDVVPYGYSNTPRYTMNFTVGAQWKGFSVMVQFYGVTGITLPQSAGEFSGPQYYSVVDKSIVGDFWLPQLNPDGRYHAPMFQLGGDATNTGTYDMVDGTSWRLKTAEIAYTFTGSKLKKVGISNLRIYLNGNNIWLYSHLNEDRETGDVRPNDNVLKYPMTKRFNLGAKIEF